MTQVLGEYCSHSYHPELPKSVTRALHVSVDLALTDERLSSSEGKQTIKCILTGAFRNSVSRPVSSSPSRLTSKHPAAPKPHGGRSATLCSRKDKLGCWKAMAQRSLYGDPKRAHRERKYREKSSFFSGGSESCCRTTILYNKTI